MQSKVLMLLLPALFFTMSVLTQAKIVLAERVVIGVPGLGVSYFPMVLAMHKGFMAQEGLEPNFIVMRLGVVAAALMSGEIDYRTSGTPVFFSRTKGLPLKVVMVMTGKPQHALVVKKPEIRNVRDLVGKPIAVNPGTVEMMAVEVFRKHNLDPKKDLKLTFTGEPGARLAVLDQGVVDGAVLDLVGTVKAEGSGFRILQNIGEVMDFPFGALTVHDKKLKNNPEQVKRIIRATLRGVEYFTNTTNKDEVVPMVNKWSKIDVKTAARVYDLGVISYRRDGALTDEGLRTIVQVAVAAGVPTSVDYVQTEIMATALLSEVLKAGWT